MKKNHSQSLFPLMTIIAGFALASSSAHADTLISSNFESDLGAWTAGGGGALYTYSSGTNYAPVGTGAANLPKSGGTITLIDALPLGVRGYTGVTVAFRNTWLNGTTTRFLYVQYAADGVNFVNLAHVSLGNGATNAASSVTLNVTTTAANQVTVLNMTEDSPAYTGAALTDTAKFRFIDLASAGADVRAYVDDIVITATPDFGAVYWDTDGSTAGSGGTTPNGIWDATAKWNPAADGTGTTAAWASGGKAVFAAGSDATGAYTVTVDGTQDISALLFKDGTPTLTGGTALRMTAATRVYTSPALSATVATPLSDDGGAWLLTKEGSGTLILSGNNSSATGGMTLSGGLTQFESAASINGTAKNVTVNAGSTVVFGASFGAGNLPAGLDRIAGSSAGVIAADNYAATNLDFNTPALTAAFLGTVGSVNYTGTLTPAGTTYRLGGGGGTLTMANTNAVTGGNALIVNGNVVLAAANDHDGGTTLNSGSLTFGNDSSLGSGTFTIAGATTVNASGPVVTTNAVAANANFTIAGTGALTLGNLTLNANRVITNNNTTTTTTFGAISGATRTLTFSGNGDAMVSGIIGTTTGTLIKNGSGTLTLTGKNSYTGVTTHSVGKLIVNGDSSTASGNVSVAASATLGGTGTIGGNTTIAATGKLEFNLSSAAGSHDKLELAAGKTLTFSAASVLTITSSGGASTGDYTLLTAPGSINGAVPATLSLPLDWEATVTKENSNTDLVLHVTSTGGGGPGPVDHFVISAIGSPQIVGTPITSITITAQDSSNATATSFTGTVTFGGTGGFSGPSATFTAGVLNSVSVTPTVSGSNLTLTVNDGASHTGTATITTIQTQYAAWAGGAAFDADADGDGVKNGLAWLLGAANPSANAISLLPAVTQSSGNLILTFKGRNAAKRGGAELNVEYSKDLGIADLWTSHQAAVPESSSTVNNVVFVISAFDANLNNVQATIPASAASPGTKLFGRLNAVTP
jgi:autotransporter-associated beta strand protein